MQLQCMFMLFVGLTTIVHMTKSLFFLNLEEQLYLVLFFWIFSKNFHVSALQDTVRCKCR